MLVDSCVMYDCITVNRAFIRPIYRTLKGERGYCRSCEYNSRLRGHSNESKVSYEFTDRLLQLNSLHADESVRQEYCKFHMQKKKFKH